jgi:hypothetical protein
MKSYLLAALLSALAAPCLAQSMGGNASLTAAVSSSRVALPAPVASYPALLIQPATGATVEAFYALGGPSVAATLASPAVPSNGVCVAVGPNTYLAGITASSTSILRLTQLTSCPPR